MQTKEYRNIDKSSWGHGQWQDEPDKLQWQDEATGLPCLIVRSTSSGSLCGYVGIVEGHPDFKCDYDNVNVEVHGGLTFAGFCGGHICHEPDTGEPDHVWWLGFDCAHASDVSPGFSQLARTMAQLYEGCTSQPTYKALEYVKAEVTQLAAQLKARVTQ